MYSRHERFFDFYISRDLAKDFRPRLLNCRRKRNCTRKRKQKLILSLVLMPASKSLLRWNKKYCVCACVCACACACACVASENQALAISMFLMLFSFLAGAKDLCQLLPLKMSQALVDRTFDAETLQIYLVKNEQACWKLMEWKKLHREIH